MGNIIEVNLSSTNGITQTESVTQWDYGYVMQILGLDVQDDTEVHFASHGEKNAIVEMGKYADGILTVNVPDILLTKGIDVLVYVYIATNEEGKTVRTARIPVKRRAKPEDYIYTEQEHLSYKALQYSKANAILSKSTGTTVSVTDSANARPKNIKLFGKGTQRQYEGNQLWKFGDVTVNGTQYYLIDLEPGDYTFSAEVTSSDTDDNTCLLYFTNGIARGELQRGNRSCVSFTITEKCNTITLYAASGYATSQGDTATFRNIMLNKGLVELPIEPYVGGEQSPSMNYPQMPEFLGESGSVVGKVLTKNLWNKEYASDVSNWKDIDNTTYRCMPVYVGKGNKITISYPTPPTGLENMYVCITLEGSYYSDYKTWIYNKSNDALIVPTVTLKSIEDDYIYIWCLKEALTNGNFMQYICNDLQIEYGDTKTDYVLGIEQLFTVLIPNELRGVPLGATIPDVIKNSPIHMSGVYWDTVEGQYYIADTKNEDGKDVQRIIELVYDGSDKWAVYGSAGLEGFYIDNLPFTDYRRHGLCNQFKVKGPTNETGNTGIWLGVHNNILYAYRNSFYDESLDDKGVSNFEAYLKENPLVITTWLDEPIVTETDVQCNVVMNYPNTTIVNDAGAYMEVEYVADTKCYIDNKFKELQTALANTNANLL